MSPLSRRRLGCQTQNAATVGSWSTSRGTGRGSPPRGSAPGPGSSTRPPRLIHERGVASTTLDDVKAAAEVSGSQLYHYFPDKDDLVQAVIDHQADTIVDNQRAGRPRQHRRAPSLARHGDRPGEGHRSQGRLPPRLARRPALRDRPAGPALHRRRIRPSGQPPSATGCDAFTPPGISRAASTPDDLAVTLLAALQGGPPPRPGPAGPPSPGNGGRHPPHPASSR